MRVRFLLLLLPGLLCAQSLAEFEKKVTEFTLPNGLRFLIIERHEAPVVSFHTYVNVGSVDDPSGETGIAHMFEHMAFKGTPTIGTKNWPKEKAALAHIEAVYDKLDEEKRRGFRSDPKKIQSIEAELKDAIATADSFVEENEYDRVVESNGGVGMNAGTGEDSTNYFYSFPENRMELWFLLESERFLHPVFREFYKERDVVREERRMRVESSPQGKLAESLLATAFSAHPYRVMPGGWASDIDNFRETEAEQFYKKYYTPGNITIGIAGDVNPAEAKRMAEKYFARLPKAPLPPMVRTVEPEQAGEKRVAVESPAQPFLAIGYKRPSQYSPDDAALDVLSEILSGGRTGLIYKELVRDKKIALGAGSQDTFPAGKYPALFLFYVIPSTGHSLEENEKALYAVIEHVKKDKVDDATIGRVRIKLRAGLIRKLDSNSGLASELCTYSANFGDWRKLFTQLEDYNKVTADDVMRVANKYLIEHGRTVAYTQAPVEGGREVKALVTAVLFAGAAFAQQAAVPSNVPSYKDLKYPPLPQVKIPVPVQFTLSNGMRIFLLEDHELPLIHGLALIHTGNLFDPPDKKGLSEFTAQVLRSGGTKAKSGDQIDEELENIAGSVESGMEETSASMNFAALKENSDTVLGVFKEILTAPEFRQDKLDLGIMQTRSGIARRNDDANGIPDRELARIIYGPTTPYGWQVEYEDLAHIHRDDLVKFYHRYYFPKNIMLAVYGDFKVAEMKEKLEKLFADWTVQQPDVPKFPEVTAKPAPGIYFAEKADVTQTFFAIGELGGTLRDKDYAALQVAANILGQGFSSRLMSQVRTKLGYAYDISAQWAANWDHPGTLRIGGSTKSQSTTETLQAVRVELDKIRSAEVTARELDEAKNGALNSFVFFFDSPAKTLSRVMRYEYYGYPKDFLQQYQKAITAVTREDVLRVAKERFVPENLAIVAVGNPKDFGKPLSTLGKVNMIDLTIPEPKVETPKADAASLERGRSLLKRAQQAMGGADKLAGIKDATQSAEMTMDPAAGGMKMKQQNRWVAPNTLRQEQELPIGKVTAYSDGKSGWLLVPQGLMPMPPPVLKQAQGEIFREWITLMLSDRDASRTVAAMDPNTVEISSAGESVQVEFDPATGLPKRQSYKEGPADVKETYLDWRDVDGIKLPFKVQIEQNGKKAGEATVSEIKLNTGLSADELSKKPEPAKK